SSPGAPLREDVDGSGRVDILDAFVLARRIDGGAGVSESFDLTGDGQVNRFDVDAVAMAAVRLKGGA
ncbi:MAG TPA: dockerin type I domain-containing protein, partial [Phycisphaerae bacterium]|nr:dockerin type I domain-containing protein [Phycisphaerae bacterium]